MNITINLMDLMIKEGKDIMARIISLKRNFLDKCTIKNMNIL